jgi:hypothetical protein
MDAGPAAVVRAAGVRPDVPTDAEAPADVVVDVVALVAVPAPPEQEAKSTPPTTRTTRPATRAARRR